MNRMVLAFIALSSLAFILHAEKVDSMTPEERAARNERIREKLKGKTPAELLYMRTGGRVSKPGSGEGKIVFFNAQAFWDSKKLEVYAKNLSIFFQVRIEVVKAEIADFAALDKAKKDAKATVAMLLIDKPGHPRSLVNYEDNWGIVNLNSFQTEAKDLDARMKKVIFRTLALTCGLADAQSIGSLMYPAKDDEAFDELYFPDRPLPNLMIPIIGHLQRLGIKLMTVRTYREACQEGWADSPKDKWQQAIWDKAHAIPDKPIRIEFDPKKDR